jgi:hypothetical protein
MTSGAGGGEREMSERKSTSVEEEQKAKTNNMHGRKNTAI